MLKIGDVAIVYATWIPLGLALLCLMGAWRGFRARRVWWRPPAHLLALAALLCLGAGMGGMPVALTNAQLQALPSYQWASVLRMGVNQPGDAEPMWFVPSAAPCPIAGGDVGTQVAAVDGGCFNAILPGRPLDVRQWGVPTTGLVDVTPQLTAAAATGYSLFFPAGKYQFSALSLTASNQTLSCAGYGWDETGQSTALEQNSTTGDFITLNGKRNAISNCLFEPIVRVAGYQIVIGPSCYACFVEKFHMAYGYDGINDVGSNTTIGSADASLMGPMAGPVGIRFAGAGTPPTTPQQNILTVNNVLINNAYPFAATGGGNVAAWAPSTAFPANAVVNTNGAIYQTLSPCTSAASGAGPSGYPAGTTPASIYTGTIADGSCQWKFVNNDMIGYLNDSWGMSATLNDFTVLNNYQCIKIADTNPSANSEPAFVHFLRLSCDHNFTNAADVEAGVDVEFWNIYAGSDFQGSGVVFGGSFVGNGKVMGGLVNVNWQAGIRLAAGQKYVVNGVEAAGNSTAGAGLHSNIEVAAGVSSFAITSNLVDGRNDQEGTPPVKALSGVAVAAGVSDNYAITGNICGGAAEITSGVCAADGGTGTHKTVSGNW